MRRLHPLLEKQISDYSGICHHMMFETKFVKELFELVEGYHNNNTPFWRIFLREVAHELRGQNGPCYSSGASEYEIYFNFMLVFHKQDMRIRMLTWKNDRRIYDNYLAHYDYISCHHYMRFE
jgi:hypothetical protein